MSDLFHDDVPDEFILRVFATMNKAQQHTFQVLTKRPERAADLASSIQWTRNIWLGTSVESMEVSRRVDYLRQVPAAVRFLSCEPLLGSLARLELEGVDWIIAGGESGPGARRMEPEWPRELRDKCTAAGIPFFFKQWGGVQKHRTGRVLDDRIWDEMPMDDSDSSPTPSASRHQDGSS